MEELALGYHLKESKERKGGGSPTKILMGKDLLKELERRRSSPSVIAKLMGIDVLPPPQLASNQNQEFKDVFEVLEPSESAKERSWHAGNGLPSLKRSGLKLKKPILAKPMSSKETFNDSEVYTNNLDSLSCLEGSNPMLKKHPHDLKYSPQYSHRNHIGVSNATDGSKCERYEFCAFEREVDAVSTFRKHPVGLAQSSLRELRSPLHHEARKRGNYDHLNNIVVLEPSLERARSLESMVSSAYSSDIDKICRRDKEHKQSESWVLHKGRVLHLLDNEDVSVAKARGPREPTRDIGKEKRYIANHTTGKVNFLTDRHLKDQSSTAQFGMLDMDNTQSSQRYSNCIHDLNGSTRSSSGSYTKLHSNKVAKESSSERWKRSQQSGDVDGGSKTLAEMFALSDSERSKRCSNSRTRVRRDKLDHDNDHHKDGCFIVLPKYSPYSFPSALNYHDLWDRCTFGDHDDLILLKDAMNLRAENSSREELHQNGHFPKTSLSYSKGKFQAYPIRDEPRLLEREINISRENSRNRVQMKCPAADKPKLVYPSRHGTKIEAWCLADNFSAPDCTNEKVLFTTDERQMCKSVNSAAPAKDLKFSTKDQKVTSSPEYLEDESAIHSDHAGSGSHKGSKVTEQPSPVSILEPPVDEDIFGSDYLKRVMANIPDLQKQIDLLELPEESEVFLSSDDESGGESLEAFRVEEDRDFSYLLDILINSGVFVANLELLCKAWHSPCSPVGLQVFEKLERKYNKIATWARPERKLLFDLINCVLSEVLAPCIDTHPWVNSKGRSRPVWGPEGPVEKVWQMLVRQRERHTVGDTDEKVLDPKWLEIGDDINMIGKQIGRMLHDDLLEEVVSEFLQCRPWPEVSSFWN